ncbi:UNVERIFIED_CONTAM: hypothetical protein K2H54_014584, partial [Gekko kuhli]
LNTGSKGTLNRKPTCLIPKCLQQSLPTCTPTVIMKCSPVPTLLRMRGLILKWSTAAHLRK